MTPGGKGGGNHTLGGNHRGTQAPRPRCSSGGQPLVQRRGLGRRRNATCRSSSTARRSAGPRGPSPPSAPSRSSVRGARSRSAARARPPAGTPAAAWSGPPRPAAGRSQAAPTRTCGQLVPPGLGPLTGRHPGQEVAAIGGDGPLQLGQCGLGRPGAAAAASACSNVSTSHSCCARALNPYRPSAYAPSSGSPSARRSRAARCAACCRAAGGAVGPERRAELIAGQRRRRHQQEQQLARLGIAPVRGRHRSRRGARWPRPAP